jgi:manganese-dependent inorganic pyrophosphatase
LFCVIDIIAEKNTTLVASSSESDIIQRTFWVQTIDGLADLGDRISRKKTIVPQLETTLV